MLDCLLPIVGLADTDCPCWDSSKPVDFNDLNKSTSGLYLSEPDTIPLRWTGGSVDCQNGGVWDMLISARKKGVRKFFEDFLTTVNVEKENKFLPFSEIGDSYYSRAQQVYNTTLGSFIEPYCVKGAMLKIKGLKIAFFSGVTSPTVITFNLYSTLDVTTALRTVDITVSENKTFYDGEFVDPFVKDLGDIRRDLNEKFFISYELPVGFIPVKNQSQKTACCGKSNKYELNPYLGIMCNVGGFQADSHTEFDKGTFRGLNDMQGIVINASMTCDYYSWLCNLAQNPNEDLGALTGERLFLGMALADGVQAQSLVFLIESLMMGTRVNEFSMIQDIKLLYAKRGHYKKIAQEAIKNLVYHMPEDVTDCLTCREDNRLVKANINV